MATPEETAPEPAAAPAEITLDKADPSVAAAFQDCQPGDTYTVVSADDESVVLTAAPYEEEAEPELEPPMEGEGNPAMAAMMAKKKGMA